MRRHGRDVKVGRRVREVDEMRAYRREHPLALWVALGIAIVGLSGILFPQTAEQTATSAALPAALKAAFLVCYTVGGFTMWLGLHRRRFKVEAAGEVLLATALVVEYAAIVRIRPESGVPGLFVLFLAIGCARRAWHIVREE